MSLSARQFVADTLAMIVFATVLAGLTEVLIVRLTVDQMVRTRLAAIPITLLTSGLYGLYRDWLFQVTRAAIRHWVVRVMIDILAFVSFNLPIYASLLWLAGAPAGQIALGVGSAVVIMTTRGRRYGLFLEFVRRLFRVPAKTHLG